MRFAILRGAGKADHIRTTVGALQLPGQQIIPAIMVAAPDAAIGIHPLIRGQECVQVNDRWHSALNADIGKVVHTDIGFIFQQDKTVFIPTSATTGF